MVSGNDFTREQRIRNREYNEGYSDGYNEESAQSGRSDAYYTGYDVGAADKASDTEASESGDFDGLSDSERELIYGDESDQP